MVEGDVWGGGGGHHAAAATTRRRPRSAGRAVSCFRCPCFFRGVGSGGSQILTLLSAKVPRSGDKCCIDGPPARSEPWSCVAILTSNAPATHAVASALCMNPLQGPGSLIFPLLPTVMGDVMTSDVFNRTAESLFDLLVRILGVWVAKGGHSALMIVRP